MTVLTDTISTIWIKTLAIIEQELAADNNDGVYDFYFSEIKLLSFDKNQAVIVTPNNLTKSLLETQYYSLIQKALLSITETKYNLTFVLENELEDEHKKEVEQKESKVTFFRHSKLNSNYTFENFVVGKSNQEAFAAAKSTAVHLTTFNPLFLYSKSGLGKTHLMHAIGNYVLAQSPLKKVLYITAEDFVDEYVRFSTRREKSEESLKDFFRTVDVFLIDDIQFLAEKSHTSEMFFNIFNILVAECRQIVITSDRSPKELEGIEERLVSRFSSGLTVSIKLPEIETLLEILKLKIVANGNDLNLFPDDVLLYLAKNNAKNVRELEGALNRIIFYNMISKNPGPITMDLVHAAFDNEVIKDRKGNLTPEKIISTTAQYYNLAPSQLTSKVRIKQITLARHIAIYLCYSVLNYNFSQIGKIFHKDHSTILSTVKKVENLLKSDTPTIKAVDHLKEQLKVR